MIKNFAHKGLKRFFLTGSTSGIQAIHTNRLRLLLAMLDKAQKVSDMDSPGARLHELQGKLKGHWSVTVQANWRLTFTFKDGDAYIVNYQDYH